MAKVKGPLLSLDASGQVGGAMVFSHWKGINYVRQLVIPTYSNTFKQAAIRQLITDCTQAWKAGDTVGTVVINASYKAAFNAAASGMALSGFDLFVKNCVAINYDGTTSPYYDGTLVAPVDPTDIGA